MKRFITLTCLLIASVHGASIPNEEDSLRDLSFVNANLKSVESVLSALQTQIDYEAEHNPSFRNDKSGVKQIRSDITDLFGKLSLMRRLTGNIEQQMSKPKRIRREAEQQPRQNAIVDTTTTLVHSATSGIQGTMQTINSLMLNMNQGVNSLFNRITNQITNIAVSTNNVLQQGVQAIGEGTNNVIVNTNQAATNLAKGVSGAFQGAVQNIGQAAQSGYQTAAGVLQGAVNSATSTVNRLTG